MAEISTSPISIKKTVPKQKGGLRKSSFLLSPLSNHIDGEFTFFFI